MKILRGRLWMLVVALAALGVATLSLGLRGAAAQDGAAVNIVDFAFDPAGVEVPVGATVTWTNLDRATHTVTQNGALLDSPDLRTGDTFAVTYEEAGTYEYFCKFHPAMHATITVEG